MWLFEYISEFEEFLLVSIWIFIKKVLNKCSLLKKILIRFAFSSKYFLTQYNYWDGHFSIMSFFSFKEAETGNFKKKLFLFSFSENLIKNIFHHFRYILFTFFLISIVILLIMTILEIEILVLFFILISIAFVITFCQNKSGLKTIKTMCIQYFFFFY